MSEKRIKNVDARQIKAQQERLSRFLDGSTKPVTVARQLQLAMWEGAGIFRNANDLRSTLAKLVHLPASDLKAASARNFSECCTVQNMCLTASLICKSALLRPESRGAHVRTDICHAWDATTSPFAHTYISQTREGIERRAYV